MVEKAKAGDKEAVNKLLDAYNNLIYKKAISYSGGKDTDDLIQVGRLAVVNAVEKFDTGKGANFTTYVIRAIVNNMLDYLLRSGKKKNKDVELIENIEYGLSDDEMAEYADLHKAIEELSETQRRIIKLYYFEDKNLHEIMLITGYTYKTVVYGRLGALKKLKELIE